MAKKDKRIKGCPNVTCPEFQAKAKYEADDNYCKKCGTPLTFVCAKCFRKIEDVEGQRLCPDCECRKKTKVSDATKKAAVVVKQKAPEALETAIEKVRNASDEDSKAALAKDALNEVDWLPADVKVVEAVLNSYTTFTH